MDFSGVILEKLNINVRSICMKRAYIAHTFCEGDDSVRVSGTEPLHFASYSSFFVRHLSGAGGAARQKDPRRPC